MPSCGHLEQAVLVEAPPEVAAARSVSRPRAAGSTCGCARRAGRIGCCDNSPGRHATAHHGETGHPIIRSVEPGEDWSWCYVDELMFQLTRE